MTHNGVRQDHRGKLYIERKVINRLTGQEMTVRLDYSEEPNAPWAATIPIPVEPKPQPKKRLVMTTNSKGEKVPVVHKPRRLHVIEARYNGKWTLVQARQGNEDVFCLLPQYKDTLLAFGRSPDCGRTWIPLEPLQYDYHHQYHIDEEVR